MGKGLLIAAVFLMLPQLSVAQFVPLVCDDRERLQKQLKAFHGATRQGQGLSNSDALIEIWVQKDSGTWLIVQNHPGGTSCIVETGEHWEAAPPSEAPS